MNYYLPAPKNLITLHPGLTFWWATFLNISVHCTLISNLCKSEPTTCGGDLQRGEYSSMGKNTHCGVGSGLITYSGHDPEQMT